MTIYSIILSKNGKIKDIRNITYTCKSSYKRLENSSSDRVAAFEEEILKYLKPLPKHRIKYLSKKFKLLVIE